LGDRKKKQKKKTSDPLALTREKNMVSKTPLRLRRERKRSQRQKAHPSARGISELLTQIKEDGVITRGNTQGGKVLGQIRIFLTN